jgi:FKBP-type peptidyl-prolyl cis-trans isomerase SlyD
MLIGDNSVVSIQYTLTNDSGEVMDQSQQGQPLTYLHGASNIIPGLEQELTGKVNGDDFKTTIAPELAYGERHEEMVQQVPRDSFPAEAEITPGMQFQAEAEQGPLTVVVTEATDETVTVDGNHPLAGMTLHFEGKIENVRDATEEEIAHGHVH